MDTRRIVYQNWVVAAVPGPYQSGLNSELHVDCLQRARLATPYTSVENDRANQDPALDRLRESVSRAVDSLSETEREFIVRFYYCGESYFEIARTLHRRQRKLETLHKRALNRLRKILAPLAREYYGLATSGNSSCPICESPRRRDMDALIEARDRTRSWRPVIENLRQNFGLHIKSPMTLIGHEKYHSQASAKGMSHD